VLQVRIVVVESYHRVSHDANRLDMGAKYAIQVERERLVAFSPGPFSVEWP